MTGWKIDNVAKQRLRVAEQRVSPVGERPFVATRIEAAAQEGLCEARRQTLATGSSMEASVASDADMVDVDQMGGVKPVLLNWFCNVSDILRLDHDDARCRGR